MVKPEGLKQNRNMKKQQRRIGYPYLNDFEVLDILYLYERTGEDSEESRYGHIREEEFFQGIRMYEQYIRQDYDRITVKIPSKNDKNVFVHGYYMNENGTLFYSDEEHVLQAAQEFEKTLKKWSDQKQNISIHSKVDPFPLDKLFVAINNLNSIIHTHNDMVCSLVDKLFSDLPFAESGEGENECKEKDKSIQDRLKTLLHFFTPKEEFLNEYGQRRESSSKCRILGEILKEKSESIRQLTKRTTTDKEVNFLLTGIKD